MTHPYWNDLYFGWGRSLWVGFMLLILSSFGNRRLPHDRAITAKAR